MNPDGAVIEADYVEPEDQSIVGLSKSRTSISLSGMSDVTLRAVLILQKSLELPLRMVDSDYSIDLILQDCPSVEALWSAIQAHRQVKGLRSELKVDHGFASAARFEPSAVRLVTYHAQHSAFKLG